MILLSGAENALYKSSFVVTTFSISLEDFASCNDTVCFVAYIQDDFFSIWTVSSSACGGNIGRLLYAVSFLYGIKALLTGVHYHPIWIIG